MLALINFFKLYREEDIIKPRRWDQNEVYAITYALLALVKQIDNTEIDEIKDIIFIKSMNKYLFKLREYEIGRKPFKNDDKKGRKMNLFSLQKGATIKHPILSNIKIKDKIQLNNHIRLVVKSKVGEYTFLK